MKNTSVTFRQLCAFVFVADTRSFTKAASQLGITQSGLSTLVKEFEKEIEVQLFDRHSRLVELTVAGRDLYPLVRRTLNSLGEALESMREIRDVERGRIRIGAPQMLACTHLPQVAAHFQRLYPNVEISLVHGLLSQHLASIASGDLDLAVGPDISPGACFPCCCARAM